MWEVFLRPIFAIIVVTLAVLGTFPAHAADEPDLIFKRSTVFLSLIHI